MLVIPLRTFALALVFVGRLPSTLLDLPPLATVSHAPHFLEDDFVFLGGGVPPELLSPSTYTYHTNLMMTEGERSPYLGHIIPRPPA